MDERLQNIIDAIEELITDSTIPKNIRAKLEVIKTELAKNTDVNMHVNKALSELDEISSSSNIQAYTRQQIWNLTSLLEMI